MSTSRGVAGRSAPRCVEAERSTVDDRPNGPAIYEIRVPGLLDPQWSSWFDGLRVEDAGRHETVIVGPVADQSALHGLLTRVRDLGLPLLSVRMIDEPAR
jgi:hypothetical protein